MKKKILAGVIAFALSISMTFGILSDAPFAAAADGLNDVILPKPQDYSNSLSDLSKLDGLEGYYAKGCANPNSGGYYTPTAQSAIANQWDIADSAFKRKDDLGASNTGDRAAMVEVTGKKYIDFELEIDYKRDFSDGNRWDKSPICFGAAEKGKYLYEKGGGYGIFVDEMPGGTAQAYFWATDNKFDTAGNLTQDGKSAFEEVKTLNPALGVGESPAKILGSGYFSDNGRDPDYKYVPAEWHHIKLTVRDRVMTLKVDDCKYEFTVKLPESYKGGYIYFAAGVNMTSFRNLKIKELYTVKPIENIPEIKVEKGADAGDITEKLPATLAVTLGNGERIDWPVKWNSNNFSTAVTGIYTFTGTLTMPDELKGRISGLNKPTVKVNVYLPDAISFTSMDVLRKNFSSWYTDEANPEVPEYKRMEKIDPDEKWNIENGHELVRDRGAEGSFTGEVAVLNLSGRKYKDFELEIDYTYGGGWNYPMVGFGAGREGAFATEDDGGYVVYLEGSGCPNIRTSANSFRQISQKLNSQLHFEVDQNRLYGKYVSDQPYSSPMPATPYQQGAWHHMKLTVANRVLTLQIDDYEHKFVVKLPETYNGGYVYLAAGTQRAKFTDLQIRDIEVPGDEVITSVEKVDDQVIDRSKNGVNIPAFPAQMSIKTSKGNSYICPVEWESNDYNSRASGNYTFYGKLSLPPEVKNPDNIKATAKVKVIIDYNPKTTLKYYFDTKEDLEDFTVLYTPESDPEKTGYATAGSINFDDKWTIGSGQLIRKLEDGLTGSVEEETAHISTITLNKQKYRNFELEVDYLQGHESWKWAMVGFGAEKPGQFATEGSYACYTEMQGTNVFWGTKYENVDSAGKYRKAIGIDQLGTDIEYNRDSWHHMKLTVLNGKATMQIDDNEHAYTIELDEDYEGGYIYLAAGTNQARFDNLAVTALNSSGKPVNIPNSGSTGNIGGLPSTGEKILIALPIAIMCVASVYIIYVTVYKRKNGNKFSN